jgi:hypothetical protein
MYRNEVRERINAKGMIGKEPDYKHMNKVDAIEQYRRLRIKYIDKLLEISYLKIKLDKLVNGKINLKALRERKHGIIQTKLQREENERIKLVQMKEKVDENIGGENMSGYQKCMKDGCDCITFHLYGGYLICSKCRTLLNTAFIEVREE